MDYKRRVVGHPMMLVRYALSAPFIYAVLFPVLLLDLVMELYHRVCFPLYGIPCVQRSHHIRFDRWKLPYLTWYEKINCFYCEYMNGFFSYATAVAGSTELYWCGIKHKSGGGFQEPRHQKTFLPYNDAGAFEDFLRES